MTKKHLKILGVVLRNGRYGSFPTDGLYSYCNNGKKVKIPAEVFEFLREHRLITSQCVGANAAPWLTSLG